MKHLRSLRILLGTTFLTAAATVAFSQTVATINTADAPLRLKSRGSFFVGGDVVRQTPTPLSSIWATPPTNAGDLTIGNGERLKPAT
jgi:hypothetical protein